MKKIALLIAALMLFLCFVPVAFAADTEYELEEFDLKIKFPQAWITFTRDIAENDPNLNTLGLSKDALVNQYEQYSIYLNSIRLEPLCEVVMTVLQHKDYAEIHNMSLLSVSEINKLGDFMMGSDTDELVKEYSEQQDVDMSMIKNANYSGYSTYSNKDITFLVLNLSQTIEGQTVFSKQYSTIVNGDMITIVLKDYVGEILPGDEALLNEIVDSLEFGHIDEKKTNFMSKFASFKTVGYSMAIAGAVVFIIVILTNNLKKQKK